MFLVIFGSQDGRKRGANIDPKIVSSLLLSGIVNILGQHDALEHLEEGIKVLEHDNVTNRNRTEALENWVTKQEEVISELKITPLVQILSDS